MNTTPRKKTAIRGEAPMQSALPLGEYLPNVTTKSAAKYMARLNRVDPALGETKDTFTAADIGDVLYGNRDTGSKLVYRLYDEGYIGGTDVGTGSKRNLRISRDEFKEFIEERCSDKTKVWER